MDDLTAIKAMLTRANLKFEEASFGNGKILSIEGNQKGYIGYLGFGALLAFDEHGVLVDAGGDEK